MANLDEGDSQVQRFHRFYSADDTDGLYAMAGPQFRQTTSRQDFDRLVDVMDVRLGDVESSERVNFNVNSTPAGTFTTIVMQTHFAKGEGEENFTFAGNGDDMVLVGWHVQSPQLALTADDIADERDTPEQAQSAK